MIRGMRAGYERLSGWGLNMFTSEELSELHTATLDVLEHAGLIVMSDEAREIFYSHGCQVDKKTNIVKIPSYLVEDAIKSAPSKILLAGRDPKHDFVMGGRRTAYTTCGTVIKAIDFETGKVRESAVKDVTEAAILTDALDEITILFIPVIPRDVPDVLGDIVAAEINFNKCTKHFQAEVLSVEDTRRVFDMGIAVAGSAEELLKRPICSIVICPVSPLQLGPDFCDVVIETARLGLPLNVLSQALSGATAPVTLAGTLIVQSAEVLGGITLAQLVRRGLPVIYGSSTSPFDLSYVNTPMGSPELGMISAGVAKLAQYYSLPSLVSGT